MARPAVTVEIAFPDGFSTPAASRTWTAVTADVLTALAAIQIDHGRQDEMSTAGANLLKLVLDNSDGDYTPERSGSPHYPNVKLGRPIRVTVTPSGGSASTRFVGYIDDWGVAWPGTAGSFATAAVSASSRLGRLGAATELRSIIEEEILLDDPDAYYPLGEAEGATTVADASGNSRPSLRRAGNGANPVFGTATGPGTDELTAVSFTRYGKYLKQTAAETGSATDISLECFMSFTDSTGDGPPPSDGVFLAWGDFTMETSDISTWVVFDAPGGAVATASGRDDGQTRHYVGTYNNTTGAIALYEDGVLVDSDTATAGQGVVPEGLTDIGGSSTSGEAGITGVIAHAAGYKSLLSLARIEAHRDAGDDGFAGETCAARLTRYATYAGIPSGEVSAETGDLLNLAHIPTNGETPLACMRDVERTEGGVLFDARDNTLTFHDRSHRYNATLALTLDVDAGEVDPAYAPKYDRFGLRNDVTATTTDGTVTARVTDWGSIDDNGLARDDLQLSTTNEEEPLQHASWLVGNYADPRNRVATLTVELAKLSAARQATVLAVNVGDRIRVTNLMSQSDATTKDFYVEGYTEEIGEATYRIVFNVSPAEISDVWILGDATYGVLGTTTKLGF